MNHPHLMNITHFRDRRFSSGHGAVLVDEKGMGLVDFFADVGTASLGYGGPHHVLAFHAAMKMPVHAPNLYRHVERDRAAERLTALTKMDRVFFCNSGAEAVEAAIKLARLHQFRKHGPHPDDDVPEPAGLKHVIWTPKGGFHGRTLATLAAGDGAPYHREGFGPLPLGFRHFEKLEDIEWNEAAAVMLAPIFGNNDVRVPPRSALLDLWWACKNNDALLIFDEVQTGSGRTGAMTYAQKVDIEPDILTLAKGIAMGAPVGACLARGAVAATFSPGSHWSTFGGNPLCAAFTNGMLDWLSVPANLKAVEEKGQLIRDRLTAMKWPRNVRGEGMLIAFDTDANTAKLRDACEAFGLILGAFREGPGPIKVTPPLNIDDTTLTVGLDILDRAYRSLSP